MGRQTKLLWVPKQNVEVDVALAGIAPRRVELFLPDQPTPHDRRQEILYFLEKGMPFFPARETSTGRWEIVNRSALLWIRLPLESLGALGDDTEELFDFRHRVRIDLISGEPLEGELLYSAQKQETRVTDYLNVEGRSFHLWHGDDVYLVNKSCVRRVIEETD